MAVDKFMDANGNIVTANNPRAVRALKKQGYTAVSSNTQPKKKVKAQNTTKQSEPWTVRDQLAGNAKISEATNVPFNQYMQMRRLAAKYPENRAYQNIVAEMTGKDGQHSRVQFDANNQFGNRIADMEATFPKGSRNSNTVPYNNMDTLAQGKGMAGLGIYRTDASKDIYRPRGYNVPSGNYREAGTYNVGIDGVVRDNTVSNTSPEAVYTATGQTYSDANGNASGVVKEPYVAPEVKSKSFQEWQDLNKIARNPDYEVGETAPEGPDMARTGVPIHPVTGLRIEKGDNWNSYTDAPSGTTYNNSNFNWNNKGFKTPTGNVDGLSQAQIDGLYGRPSSPVQPKQKELDTEFWANLFKN
jgi:hypothetical protein